MILYPKASRLQNVSIHNYYVHYKSLLDGLIVNIQRRGHFWHMTFVPCREVIPISEVCLRSGFLFLNPYGGMESNDDDNVNVYMRDENQYLRRECQTSIENCGLLIW